MHRRRQRALLALLVTVLTLTVTWVVSVDGPSAPSSSSGGFPVLTAASNGHRPSVARAVQPAATAAHRAYRVLSNTVGPAGGAATVVPPMVMAVGLLVVARSRWCAQACPGGPLSRGPPSGATV